MLNLVTKRILATFHESRRVGENCDKKVESMSIEDFFLGCLIVKEILE